MIDWQKIANEMLNIDIAANEGMMASPRSYILDRVEDFSQPLFEHIVKCAVFGKTSQYYSHWVYEIATYLDIINSLEIKTKSRKLDANDYREQFMYSFGESSQDTYQAIRSYSKHNDRKKRYPHFDATQELAEKVFLAGTSVLDEVCPILATVNQLSIEDIVRLVSKGLDRAI